MAEPCCTNNRGRRGASRFDRVSARNQLGICTRAAPEPDPIQDDGDEPPQGRPPRPLDGQRQGNADMTWPARRAPRRRAPRRTPPLPRPASPPEVPRLGPRLHADRRSDAAAIRLRRSDDGSQSDGATPHTWRALLEADPRGCSAARRARPADERGRRSDVGARHAGSPRCSGSTCTASLSRCRPPPQPATSRCSARRARRPAPRLCRGSSPEHGLRPMATSMSMRADEIASNGRPGSGCGLGCRVVGEGAGQRPCRVLGTHRVAGFLSASPAIDRSVNGHYRPIP